ncbi:MAG: hypothetical protein K6F85_07020 [Bacteroidales bacterium]|nr:hypothetical protein [Bacteroidales bacterium]
MKKIIIPLVAVLMLAMTTSCDREDDLDYRTVSANVTITASNWVTNAFIDYYYARVAWNALTTDVVENGQVHAYIYNEGRQNPLPYVVPVTYYYYDDAGVPIDTITVGENLRFDFEPGYITFILEDLDGNPPDYMLDIPDYTIRVCAERP